jgi:hypothetical protein
VSRWLDGVDH